jgi:hypothetical protein
MIGNISRSIEQGRSGILDIIEVLNKYSPALILLLTKVVGFSTNLSISPEG